VPPSSKRKISAGNKTHVSLFKTAKGAGAGGTRRSLLHGKMKTLSNTLMDDEVGELAI